MAPGIRLWQLRAVVSTLLFIFRKSVPPFSNRQENKIKHGSTPSTFPNPFFSNDDDRCLPPSDPSLSSSSRMASPSSPLLLLLLTVSSLSSSRSASSAGLTLGCVRDALIRQEDSIVFSLIERSRFPYNAPAYDPSFLGSTPHGGDRSLAELYVREAEALQAKAGLYQKPEEVPFFLEDLSFPVILPYNYPQVLHPASASVSVNEAIWNMYFNELLPLFTAKGDDGNYAATVASDLVCLQALSRRIHYGMYVAEVKFTDAPEDYTPAIHAKDTDALMKLLTFEVVEAKIKRRVEKKTRVFGQNVTLEDKGTKVDASDGEAKYKVDPSVVSRLYDEWVMPLTKQVQVEYLLHRLD